MAPLVREAVADTASDAAVQVDETVRVLVDPDHLGRIVVNYLVNAARYGRPPVTVAADASDDCVDIRVSDAGDGVPEAFVDRLFTSFARADSSSPEGTGLGLSIVRGLARVNGGEAFYERRAEGGGCFGITLPVVPYDAS